MRRLIIIALLAYCGTAQAAANWELVGENQIVSFSIDRSSIGPRGHYLKVWVMWDYPELRKDAAGREYRSAASLTLFDCKGRTLGIQSEVNYAQPHAGGAPVSSRSWPLTAVAMEDIVPGTAGEYLAHTICPSSKSPRPSPR